MHYKGESSNKGSIKMYLGETKGYQGHLCVSNTVHKMAATVPGSHCPLKTTHFFQPAFHRTPPQTDISGTYF